LSTQDERLTTVEYGLKQFKTETIKAYQDVAMELTMIKGLNEDAVRRLMTLKIQIDQRFDTVGQQIAEVKQDTNEVKQSLASIEGKFDQMLQQLAILTKKPE